jgi:hypothetical protein
MAVKNTFIRLRFSFIFCDNDITMVFFLFIQNNTFSTNQSFTRVRRLSKTKVAEARSSRLREIQMWSFVQQLLIYSCYLSILYAVSYANRNPHSYQQVQHLRNFFLNSHNSTYNYMKVLFFWFFLIFV